MEQTHQTNKHFHTYDIQAHPVKMEIIVTVRGEKNFEFLRGVSRNIRGGQPHI